MAAETDDLFSSLDVPTPQAFPQRRAVSTRRRTPGLPRLGKGAVARIAMIATILSLNVCFLGIAFLIGRQMWVISILEGFVGLILAASLLLPRLHLIDKAMVATQSLIGGAGAAMAGMGTVGLLVLLLKVGGRTWGRLQRKQAEGVIDLSGGGGMSLESLSGLLFGLVLAGLVLTLAVFLWHKIGIVRVAASAYLMQLTLLSFTMTYGYLTLGPMREPGYRAPNQFAASPESSPWSRDMSPAGSIFDPNHSSRSHVPSPPFPPARWTEQR